MYPTPKKVCPTCSGSKEFRWFTQGRDLDSVDLYACPCDDQFRMSRWFLHSGIMDQFQQLGWDDLLHVDGDVLEWSLNYIENHLQMINAGWGVFMTGPSGTGKTLVATLVLKALIAEGVDCYNTAYGTILDSMVSGWKDKADKDWYNSRLLNTSVLLIDGIGRKTSSKDSHEPGTFAGGALEQVLRHRVERSLPTFITSDQDAEWIGKSYGQAAQGLLMEQADVFHFSGSSRSADRAALKAEWRKHGIYTPPVTVA